MGYRCRLHIHRQRIRIQGKYPVEILAAVHKDIPRRKKAFLSPERLAHIGIKRTLKTGRTSGSRTWLCTQATPHIMVSHFCGKHHIEHARRRRSSTRTTGHSGVYHNIRLKEIQHICSPQSGIHLAYAALAYNYIAPGQTALIIITVTISYRIEIFKHGEQQLKLLIHRHYDTYFHILTTYKVFLSNTLLLMIKNRLNDASSRQILSVQYSYASNFFTITVALWPPKPNEFERAARTSRF